MVASILARSAGVMPYWSKLHAGRDTPLVALKLDASLEVERCPTCSWVFLHVQLACGSEYIGQTVPTPPRRKHSSPIVRHHFLVLWLDRSSGRAKIVINVVRDARAAPPPARIEVSSRPISHLVLFSFAAYNFYKAVDDDHTIRHAPSVGAPNKLFRFILALSTSHSSLPWSIPCGKIVQQPEALQRESMWRSPRHITSHPGRPGR